MTASHPKMRRRLYVRGILKAAIHNLMNERQLLGLATNGANDRD